MVVGEVFACWGHRVPLVSGKTSNGAGFITEDLEDGEKFRDSQNIFDGGWKIEQFELASSIIERCVGADKFADARAVYMSDGGEIEDDFPSALVGEGTDGIAEGERSLGDGQPTGQVEDRHVADIALANGEHSSVPPASSSWLIARPCRRPVGGNTRPRP